MTSSSRYNAEAMYQKIKQRLAQGAPDFSATFCANDLSTMGRIASPIL
jgi:hypothetical protein